MLSTDLGFLEGMSHRSISMTEATVFPTGWSHNELKAI